jgi:AcrR family transcriptional regulator
MDTALELFLTRGYLTTTVQDIVRKVGVAQGTFYYYYPSKEAILEAIFARYVTHMIAEVQSQSIHTALPSEKLQLFVNRFYSLCCSGESGLMAKVLYKEKQGALINQLWRQTHVMTTPLLVRIIEDGVQQGQMKVGHIEESLVFFAGIMGALLEASSPLEFAHESDPEIIAKKLVIAATLIETLFGTPAGTIQLTILND